MDEVTAALILSHAPYLGSVKVAELLTLFGKCEKAFHALINKKELPFKLRKETLHFLEHYESITTWQEDAALAVQHKTILIPITSPQYPKKLRAILDPPLILYVKGTLPQEEALSIAIVGTRNATFYGNEQAHRFGDAFGVAGCPVISGLARGIDTSAHKGALKKGITVAVIGSGLAHIYPAENIALANAIEKQGAIISELPMNTSPTRFTFPRRNRIISGLSDAILLIEAPEKSGAMITMEIAKKQNKPLFALPGRAGSDTCCGNHMLIKTRAASLVDGPEEILKALNYQYTNEKKRQEPTRPDRDCTPHEKKILGLLQESEMSLEELSNRISLPIGTLQSTLIKLTLRKFILELPGKRYTLHTS